jgi:transposase
MRDWLAEGHLAWFVLEVVAEMDTSGLHRRPGGSVGRRPYEPEMMCALVLYAYCCGMRSSRRIESACQTDAAFRVICGGLVPDHATIARFVADQEQALESLFVEGLRLCAAAGLVDLSVIALDGTKIAADAALDRNRDAEWIRREIAKLMAITEQEQPSETPAGIDGLAAGQPDAELGLAAGRAARLRAALKVIQAQDAVIAAEAKRAAQAAAAEAKHGRKLAGRKPTAPHAALARAEVDHGVARDRLAAMGAQVAAKQAAQARGQQLKAPPPCRIRTAQRALEQAQARLAAARQAAGQSTAAPEHRANITDPDSRIMKTQKGWVQGYNAQAIVNHHQIVLACDVSQDAFDVGLYQPMINTLHHTLTAAGITTEVELALADAGYWSEHNATAPGPDRLIATLKDHKQRRAARLLGHTNGPPPPNVTPIEEMEHLLRTPQGTAAYAQRSHLIEPVFGDRKTNRGMSRFRRRGLNAVRSEWALMHLAGNLLKLRDHQVATTAA